MGLPVNISGAGDMLGSALYFQVSAEVFWAYFLGAAISIAWLPALRSDVLLAQGSDKLISWGPVFFALPMAVFGSEHFTAASFVEQLVPKWIPWPWFWTYFVGSALILAALSIVLRKEVWLSAPLLGLMLFLFVVLMSVPNIRSEPRNRLLWMVGFRDLSFSGGALVLAGMQAGKWSSAARKFFIQFGRSVITLAILIFGVQQILHPDLAPGVPLDKQTPTWIPLHAFWAYLAGAVFLVAGALLLMNRKTRAAATVVGAMVLLLVFVVYLPILAATLKDIDNGWNYFVDTLAFSGTALLLADAMPKEEAPHV